MTDRQIDNRVAKLDELDRKIKEMTKAADALKKELQEELGDRETLDGKKWVVSWKWYEYPHFNKARLPKETVDALTDIRRSRKFNWNMVKA